MAGAALFAVPVAVAALIGFGSGFAGVAGGLSSVTNGPDAVPAAAQTRPTKLNRAVVALANRQTTSSASGPSSSPTGGSTGGSTGTTGSSGTSGTTGSSGTSSGSSSPITIPSTPDVSLPGTGSSGSGGAVSGATDAVNGTLDNVLGGVNNTLNGLLGK